MTSTTLRDREPTRTGYRLETVSQAFERVQHGEDPWIAIGDFLDDWGRAEKDKRRLLVSAPIILKLDDPNRKWAALFAAITEWLCWTSSPRIGAPAWVNKSVFELPEPWFVTPGKALRNWQLVHSPAPFRSRRIFTDASIVSRA